MSEDRLNRREFATAASRIIRRVELETDSTVFALIGEWGAGKTSLINLVEANLRATSRWTVIRFNPWETSSLESLMRYFFRSIEEGIRGASPSEAKAREGLRRYARALAPSIELLRVPFPRLDHVAHLFQAKHTDDPPLGQLRTDLANRMVSLEPILLVLDDIDRLQGDEMRTLLKLVRLAGRLPNVHYLLAFDEASVTTAMTADPSADGDASSGRQYLEKIVQVRLDLPPLLESQFDSYFQDMFTGFVAEVGRSLPDREMVRFRDAYPAMRAALRTPRKIKRLFAQLEAFHGITIGELNFVDYFLLTLLRTEFPIIYQRLYERKEELTGEGFESGRISTRVLEELLACAATLSGGHEIKVVLDSLFPYTGSPASSLPSRIEMEREQRLGSPKYFDRYFFFGVPAGDVSDGSITRALHDLGSHLFEADSVGQLRQNLRTHPSATLRKLLVRAQGLGGVHSEELRLDEATALGLLRLLSEEFEALGNTPRAPLAILEPQRQAVYLAVTLLESVHVASTTELESLLSPSADLLLLAVDRLDADTRKGEKTASDAHARLKSMVLAQCREVMEEAANTTLAQTDVDRLMERMFAWFRLATNGEVSAWLKEKLDSAESPWTMPDFLGAMVGLATSWSDEGAQTTLGSLQSGGLFQLLTEDEIVSRLPEGYLTPPDQIEDETDTSFANRVARARRVLGEILHPEDDPTVLPNPRGEA
jgi:hypothetical protein